MTTTKTEIMRARIDNDTDCESPRDWDNIGTMVCWHSRYNLGDEQPTENAEEYLRGLAIEVCPRLEEIIDDWEYGAGWDLLDNWTIRNCAFDDDFERWTHRDRLASEHIDDLVQSVLDSHYLTLPLYLYDHSGLSMSTGAFNCPWDSGKVGFIYCTRETALSEFETIERAEKCMRAEVETYDQYLRGEVYSYSVESAELPAYADSVSQPVDTDSLDWQPVDSCTGFYGWDIDENGILDGSPTGAADLLRRAMDDIGNWQAEEIG